ncbi:Uncharacterised protein [uncultured archaeon]|nr:Uncharacterised protein [uncultured archaeon]
MPSKYHLIKRMYILFANTINKVYRCTVPGLHLREHEYYPVSAHCSSLLFPAKMISLVLGIILTISILP